MLFLSISPPWIGLPIIFLGLALQSVLSRGGSFFPTSLLPDVFLLFCIETFRSLLAGHWGSGGPSRVLSHSYREQKLESMSPWPVIFYLPFVLHCLLPLSPWRLLFPSFLFLPYCSLYSWNIAASFLTIPSHHILGQMVRDILLPPLNGLNHDLNTRGIIILPSSISVTALYKILIPSSSIIWLLSSVSLS